MTKQSQANPQQLVIRLDTASGVAKVGWAAELPLGRFEHIDLVCEAPQCEPLTQSSAHYSQYLTACQKAKEINQALLHQQHLENRKKNWLPVPLDLYSDAEKLKPDAFGNYQALAMQALHRLCRNHVEVWVVVEQDEITQLKSRIPPREMEELEYQVWLHHSLQLLGNHAGETRSGNLAVQPSGLWFVPDE